jgi:hypothetical protein
LTVAYKKTTFLLCIEIKTNFIKLLKLKIMTAQTLKNIIICLLLCLFSALLTYYFCCQKADEIPDITRSLTDVCMDYHTEAPATLTTEMVTTMVTQYSGAQLNSIQTATLNPVPEDARSIWFDLETLKAFMYQVEYNAKKKKATIKNEELGIRIYYAAYPNNSKMRALAASQTDPNFSYNPDYEKLHTLVMMPTIAAADGVNYDFNPLDLTTFNGFANTPRTGSTYNANSASYTTLSLGTSSAPAAIGIGSGGTTSPSISARNHGELNPPAPSAGIAF